MKKTQGTKEILQWHPAFYAGLQIELADEADWLTFENEHQLGTKPKEIDVLIIKKEKNYRVKKNIGRMFKKYNIIEYKSPSDYLSIDDFYRVYGYACFYKADTGEENSISIKELTLTFVSGHYPRKLADHLKRDLGYRIREIEPGIYYTESDMLSIQFIITSRLSQKENLWLRSLTDDLKQMAEAKNLVTEYQKRKDNPLYRSVMDIIVRANREKFQEVKEMCSALEELMKDEIEAYRAKGLEEGLKEGLKEGLAEGLKEGLAEGLAEGLKEGLAKGLKKGEKLTLISMVQKKVKRQKNVEDIAAELEESLDSISDIYDMVKAYPDENNTEIYQRLYASGE